MFGWYVEVTGKRIQIVEKFGILYFQLLFEPRPEGPPQAGKKEGQREVTAARRCPGRLESCLSRILNDFLERHLHAELEDARRTVRKDT